MPRKNRKEDIAARNAGVILPQTKPQPKQITYQVGIYTRLSIFEQRDRKDSEALQNQKALLLDYVAGRPELILYAVYQDNGETGTNFDRADFQRMMEDVRAGKVNCILVKDLSRFGRDHIETGEYLEHIFPFMGVRFIAVNDAYDSLDPSSGSALKAALKNIVNEVYSKDISRKSGSVLRAKQRRGEFIGAYAAYGYRKDPANNHHLIVDEEVAPVVRELFRRKAEGESDVSLVRWLNAADVLSPCTYRYQKGILTDPQYADRRPWKTMAVKGILRNEVYLGNLVQGRRISEFYAGRPDRYRDKADWVVVPNTHEAIVDRATFDRVQALMQQRKDDYQANLGKYEDLGTHENLFRGLIYCGDCGRRLTRYKTVSHGKRVFYSYICPTYEMLHDQCSCTLKNMKEDVVTERVRTAIWHEIALTVNLSALFAALAASHTSPPEESLRLSALQSEQKKVELLRRRVSEDYLGGTLDAAEYDHLKQKYEQEAQQIATEVGLAQSEAAQSEELCSPRNKWLSTVKQFVDHKELTREMVQALVEKIVICDNARMELFLRFADEKAALLHYAQTALGTSVEEVPA